MSVLDLTLVKSPYGTGANHTASIDGWTFTIDPTSVQLPMRAKMQKFRTVGGFVVQVYGTTWGDLTISGQFGGVHGSFGTGGWELQERFLGKMMQIAQDQAIQRQARSGTGQNFSPAQPFLFRYPLLGWEFYCYLKGYTSPDGPMAVHLENTNINPKWTLTLFIVTDNNNSLKIAKGAYLQRLAPGLGVMWDSAPNQEKYTGYSDDKYNSPLGSEDVQNYVNSPTGLGSVADVVPATPSNFSGPTTQPDGTGTTGGVVPGKPGAATGGKPVTAATVSQQIQVAIKQWLPSISAAATTWLTKQFVGIAGAEGGTTGLEGSVGGGQTATTYSVADVLNVGYGPGATGTWNAPLSNYNPQVAAAYPGDTEYSVGTFGINIGYDYYNGVPTEVNYNTVAKYLGVGAVNGAPDGASVQSLGTKLGNRFDVQALVAIELYKGAGPSFQPWVGDKYVNGPAGVAAMDAQAKAYGIA